MMSTGQSAPTVTEADIVHSRDHRQTRDGTRRERRSAAPQKESMGERRTRLLGVLDQLLAAVDTTLYQTVHLSELGRREGTS